ncbi:MAG: hypothetical protein Ta2D_08210 [Rickettsiales bacterium]|nr:MAG: hypothetical protein Ta2D_08210 [Rickettsiales bacterium]
METKKQTEEVKDFVKQNNLYRILENAVKVKNIYSILLKKIKKDEEK